MIRHTTQRRLRTGLTLATITVSAALALAGCAAAAPQVASLDKQTTTPTATTDAVKAFYDCLESTGLKVTRGAGDIPDFGEAKGEDIMNAQKKCAPLAPAGSEIGNAMSGTSKPNGDGGGLTQEEAISSMRKFSKCMRDEGITDYPDPDANGGMTFSSPKDPKAFNAASKACNAKTGIKSGFEVSGE